MIQTKNVATQDASLFDTRPAHVRAWLDRLPSDAAEPAARKLLLMLGSIKHRDIPVRQRYQLLEAVTATLSQLLPDLAVRYSGKPLPLAQENRETVELSTALQLEVIHGYQQILKESSRLYLFSWRRIVSSVIHRLFRYRSNILCNYRLCYLPYPPGVWKQLFWYYTLAEDHRLLRNRVKLPGKRPAKSSLESEFKRLMLLSLLSPNHFEANSMNEVYSHLGKWVDKVTLNRCVGTVTTKNVFLIDLQGDGPPQVAAQVDTQRGLQRMRCLDVNELIGILRKLLSRSHPDKGKASSHRPGTVSLGTLQNLLAGWNRAQGRTEDRRRTHEQLPIAVGIGPIYALLSGSKDPSAQTHNTAGNGAIDARLVDYSNHGFRLRLEAEKVHHLNLDDLVALRNPNDGHWALGQIRWMQSQDDNKLHVGVMALSQQVLPVLVRNDDSPAPSISCLLGLNNPQPVLYLPRGHDCQAHDKLWLVHSEHETRLTLGEIFSATHGFTAYYSHLKSADNHRTD